LRDFEVKMGVFGLKMGVWEDFGLEMGVFEGF
jgi:hypothetical protein